MASRKELSHQPPWGLRTSSLVSLEADLARADLGLSEAASAGPSRLLSWHREEKVWVGRRWGRKLLEREAGGLIRAGSLLRLGHPSKSQIYITTFLKGLGQPGSIHHLSRGQGIAESLILPNTFEY